MPGIMNMDPATIPQVMKMYFGVIQPLALAAAVFLFVLEILDENAKTLRDQPANYAALLFKTAAVIIGIFMYSTIFLAIVCLCQTLSFMVFSMEDWGRMQSILNNFGVSGSLVTLSADKLMLIAAKYLSTLVEEVVLVVRYALLSVLYMTGPFAFVFALYSKTSKVLSGWFRNVLDVSFWIVTLRILQSVYACTGMLSIANQQDIPPAQYLIFSVTYFVLVVMVPMITSTIFSGGMLGPVASIATGAAASIVTYATDRVGRGINGMTEGAIVGLGRYLGMHQMLGASSGMKGQGFSGAIAKSANSPAPIAPKTDPSAIYSGTAAPSYQPASTPGGETVQAAPKGRD